MLNSAIECNKKVRQLEDKLAHFFSAPEYKLRSIMGELEIREGYINLTRLAEYLTSEEEFNINSTDMDEDHLSSVSFQLAYLKRLPPRVLEEVLILLGPDVSFRRG